MPCTRDSPEWTPSSGPVPHSPRSWAPTASTASGLMRTRATAEPSCAPSSCQRTRSTTSAAVNDRGCSQTRSFSSPFSPKNSTRSAVQTRRWASSAVMKSSAAARTPNATWSTRSRGGSKSTCTSTSRGGMRGVAGRGSRPAARACSRAPIGPNRATTSPTPSAANSPRVRMPSRGSSDVSSGSSSSVIGRSARKAPWAPGGTMVTRRSGLDDPACAARSAANSPSAMPTRARSTSRSVTMPSTVRAAACSPP